MIALNLTASGEAETRIKDYLERNVSETLADKINNGVLITKDDKELLNKKTLSGFMRYATEEAKKIAEKGAQYACISDETVFGWAIHYFEEETIVGTLYNADGSEYEPPKPVTKPNTQTYNKTATTPKKPPQLQASLFDLIDKESKEEQAEEQITEDDEEPTEEEVQEALAEMDNDEEQPKSKNLQEIEEITRSIDTEIEIRRAASPLYQKYLTYQERYPNKIIALRLGDFYEVFGDDAVKLADYMDLTLTGRDCGLPERVPMVGFPYHVSENYFGKIIKKYPLVVVENENDIQVIPTYDEAIKSITDNTTIDYETGEIIQKGNSVDDDSFTILKSIFGCDLEVQ